MSFLSPWTALLAAAVVLPLLALLYFLKLRRRRLRIASTLLWRRSFEDLQVNAPFQRLRITALFVLQLLALLALLLAVGDPVIRTEGDTGSRLILLVDRSASMSTLDVPDADGPISRLDAARRAATDIVDRLARRGGAAMVVTFGAQPQIVSGFESRRQVLVDAIESIRPTHEEADLAAALRLATTFAGRGEQTGEEPPDVVLVSDGGVAPPEGETGFTLRAGRFRYVRVGPEGEPPSNVGIVGLSARRDRADPTRVNALVRVQHTGREPVDTAVTLTVSGQDRMRRVTLPAAASAGAAAPTVTVSFGVDLPGDAIVAARHHARDALAVDDTAALVLPAPARPRIAFVHGDDGPDRFLRDLIAESGPRELRLMTLAAFEAEDPVAIDLGERFDLVVFDGVAPARLPGIPSLTFGAVPSGLDANPPEVAPAGGRRILSWQRQHAVMRYVSLDTIVFAGAPVLELPAGATALATGPDGPVIALAPARGAAHIVVAFALERSNWPTHVSVAVFVQNALDYLTLARSGRVSRTTRPGEPVTVRARADAQELLVTGPGDREVRVPASPGAPVTLPVLRLVGVYGVAGAEPPGDRIAVSALSEVESDNRPRDALVVNASEVRAGAARGAAPRGIWPWLAGAALVLLVVEWIVYCLRSRV